MISFAWPWLLALIPLPIIIYWLPAKKRAPKNNALKVPLLIQTTSSVEQSDKQKKSPLVVLSLCWLFFITALAQPQWLGEPVDIPTQGREMMLAVDLSGSMDIEDMNLNGRNVNRLQMLKVVLGDFIERRVGDRLGLILFADDAYMQTPMTFDRKTVKQMLHESELGLVGRKTAIGDAIGLAVKRFDAKKESNKVLLLLTDGQNTSGKISPEEALALAVNKGITIYTIGIGADVMMQQSLWGAQRINPSSDLDETSLTQIAEQTGGQYFRARDSQSMSDIYALLDSLEPIEQDQQQMRPLSALFYWPLAIAALLAFLYLVSMNFSLLSLLFIRKQLTHQHNSVNSTTTKGQH
ncbi:VWA domain-containing protein [Colwellia asteriadis]|uniref:VWA domain-containing protein n=1 Tax=Colwellia asteriadis TaxID=517723 RepID=A0ABN1LA60_9GAMM